VANQTIVPDLGFPVKDDAVLVNQPQPSADCRRQGNFDSVVIPDVSVQDMVEREQDRLENAAAPVRDPCAKAVNG
jgi:hypothetical protein